MTEKRRFLDIWIVESNTVYKEVPFAVVTDWVQQGRLLEDDMFKPSGTRDWIKLGGWGEFVPYFPRPEPNRTEDRAEALEPVHVDFTYKRGHDEEDDDVDMIPLIDVSLVLLVFFMLTATGASMSSFVRTPEVQNTHTADSPDSVRIDIARDRDERGNPVDTPVYSVGFGNLPADKDDKELATLNAVLERLKARLDQTPGQVEVVINADRDLPAKHVRNVLLLLRRPEVKDRIRVNYFGATQREE